MRRTALIATALATALLMAACASSGSASNSASNSPESGPVTLTLWHNYGTEQNAVATQKLTDAYHQLHPNVTFNVVSQPADNYFALLKTAAIAGTIEPTAEPAGTPAGIPLQIPPPTQPSAIPLLPRTPPR